eukprot:5072833-Pleurochrysis_carterae.AAC.1
MIDGKTKKLLAGQELSFQQIPFPLPFASQLYAANMPTDGKDRATAGSFESNNKQIGTTTAYVAATECLIVVPTTL